MTTVTERWSIHPEHGWLHGRWPAGPVVQDPDSKAWNVYGYPESMAVLGDPATFSSRTAQLFAGDSGEVIPEGDLLQIDPPDHRKQRELVRQAFTPRLLAGWEPRIEDLTTELLEAVRGEDHFDVVASLASPLPVLVVGKMLGLPRADLSQLAQWMRQMAETTGDLSPTADAAEQERVFAETAQIMTKVVDYLREHVRDRPSAGEDALLDRLVNGELDGERLTEDYVVAFAKSLLIAGYLTTSMLIGNTVLCLDAMPDLDRAVRADRALLPGLVEESMRFLSPIAATYRVTAEATVVADQKLDAGSLVLVWMGAANRDPRQFTHPDVFDPRRDPNPHLGFGRGIHFCLGAPLARMEARIALTALFDRYPRLRTLDDHPPKILPSFDTTGVSALYVATG